MIKLKKIEPKIEFSETKISQLMVQNIVDSKLEYRQQNIQAEDKSLRIVFRFIYILGLWFFAYAGLNIIQSIF